MELINTSANSTKARGIARGFEPSLVQHIPKTFYETSLSISVCYALLYLISIPLLALPTIVLWFYNQGCAALVLYLVILPFIARQMRGLENMVHDASHWNWSRGDRDRRERNDICANIIGAWPMMMSVQSFRRTHMKHHGDYGSEGDPCHDRYASIRKSRQGKSALGAIAQYAVGFYVHVAHEPRAVARMLLWHCVALLLPLSMVVGPAATLVLWTVFWLVPMVVVLPLLRMPAEENEHDYDALAEAEGTISHVGGLKNALLYPCGDGYHWLHHCVARVPLYRMRALHCWAITNLAQYRASRNGDDMMVQHSAENEV